MDTQENAYHTKRRRHPEVRALTRLEGIAKSPTVTHDRQPCGVSGDASRLGLAAERLSKYDPSAVIANCGDAAVFPVIARSASDEAIQCGKQEAGLLRLRLAIVRVQQFADWGGLDLVAAKAFGVSPARA